MKKLLVSLFALVLLATGCSGGGSSSDSVVCEVDGTTPMTVELTNADGKIGKMIFTMEDEDDSYAEIDDEYVKELQDYFESSYAAYDGLDIEVDVDGKVMTVVMTLDVQKADSLPSEFNMTGSSMSELQDMDFDDAVAEIKSSDDVTCK
ncbi:hypothetical protein [Breznakia pachnodae]|uniref:DUF1307 domain-containing protein n=1 Tax=Breznakia pachnodae TaxID=265178 RepID=A0ABU0E075_9FIRM|nr:hypothetical protein [Breznakia pachnodae]MDQ0360282.1 hypothetical protein [Breznakia pachnodae]